MATAGPPLAAPPLVGDVAADVAIVGGGFTGCSAALHLAEAGAAVRLLEAAEIGFGGSGRNAGLVNAGLWLAPEEVEAALGPEAGARLNEVLGHGPDLVFELIRRHAISCGAVRNGTLHCAHSPAGLAQLEERARQFSARGARVEILPREAAGTKLGTDSYFGALLDYRAGTIQPLAYCHGLATAAMRAGAAIHEQSPATRIFRHGGKWQVSTARGQVTADSLLIATDAYHSELATEGTPRFVPVHYFQFATRPLSHNVAATILPERQGAWDTAPVMSSFRMDPEGRLIVGAMGSLGSAGSAIHRQWARRKLKNLYPQAAEEKFEFGWFGRIAMTSDHLPRILRLGSGGYSIYGYSGRGISPGTVFGKAVAECMIKSDEALFPLKPVEQHQEPFRLVKQIFLETGVSAFHLVSERKALG